MTTKKRRRRHTPEQIVKKLQDAAAMLNAGPGWGGRAEGWFTRFSA